MKEVVKYKGDDWTILRYDSVSEFMAAEIEPEYTGTWTRDRISAEAGRFGNWHGTKSWEEVMDLQRRGWKEGADRVVRGLEQAHLEQSYSTAPSISYDVAGAFADVPRYVSGDPYCMWDEVAVESKSRPIVRLMVSGCYSGSVETTSIENYGIAMLSHIDRLEEQGMSVEVVLSITSKHFSLNITIKNAGEPLELDRLAFYLAHPSMLRRFGFRSIENHTDQKEFGGTYGSTTRLPKHFIDPGVNFLPGIDAYGESAWKTMKRAVAKMGEYIGPDGRGMADDLDEKDGIGHG